MSATSLRLIVLAALGAVVCVAVVLARTTAIETTLVRTLFGEPGEGQVYLAIGIFRFVNHIWAVPIGAVLALVGERVLVRVVPGRLAQATARVALPSVVAWMAVGLVMQWLPAVALAAFIGVVALLATVDRLRTSSTVAVARHAVLSQLACYTLAVLLVAVGLVRDRTIGRDVERIADGNYHGLEIDHATDRLLATELDSNRLDAFSLTEMSAPLVQQGFPTTELENLSLNALRDEFYHFDRQSNQLRVYGMRDLAVRRQSTQPLTGHGTAQVAHDNETNTIYVVREGDEALLFDMTTLALLHRDADVGLGNADLLFSRILRRYVLTYFEVESVIRTFDPVTRQYETWSALPYQNDVQESIRRREVYVTVPVEAAVHVFPNGDFATTPRVVPTVFGVRGMVYDEENDVLLTASMVSGYLDVIEMQTGRVRERVFVGYYLRELQVDPARRQVFVSSPIGGVYRYRY